MRNRPTHLFMIALTGIFFSLSGITPISAQDEAAGTEAAQPAAAQPVPAQPAPAQPAAPDVQAPVETPPAAEEIPQNESYLGWMIRSSGLFGLVLLLLSFVMVAVIAMNILQVRRAVLLPPEFIEDFEELLNNKKYQDAYNLAKEDDSFLARVMATGLSRINQGYKEAVAGMQEVGEEEAMGLEHRLSYLALIGQIAPMIGLMGTVYGMIDSFRVIARTTTQPKTYEIADGISTALFTTLEGLAVAIPAMIVYSLIHNQIQRLILEVGIVSEGFMSRFSTVVKTASAENAPKQS